MKGDYGNAGSLITAQYSPHWRMLRRLSTIKFFVTSRLDAMRGVHGRCIDMMVQFVEDVGAGGTKSVDVGRFFFLMASNLIGSLMFSKDYWIRNQREEPNSFIMAESMEENGGCYDEEKRKDFLDVLLEFRGDGVDEPATFSSRTINVIVFEMFTAGTDTTTSTLEWAMAELLHNPKKLRKVQDELRSTIGKPNKKLEEKDIENLPYLKAVIKETLRLHPPLPFIVPHMAMDSCKIMCPALPLASRVLPLALGSLLYSFDWVLADGIKAKDMDMSERMGITLRKSVPLKAIPIPYNVY
ncbi:hypothetical protein Q3G72_028774 [Acer saccharum]|nr:hypothetical protein Q3G72_028774 [Acer saccharum]